MSRAKRHPDRRTRDGVVPARSLQRVAKPRVEPKAAAPLVHRLPAALRLAVFANIGLASSLAIHACIVLLAYSTWSIGKQVMTRTQEQSIIPDAMIIQGAEVGGIPNPGLGGDPTRKAASADPGPSIASNAWSARPSREFHAAVMSTPGDLADSMIGVGARVAREGASPAGPGDAGPGAPVSAPFGMPGGGAAIAPKSSFMGVSGNARKIIFVCDCSGSMAGAPRLQVNAEIERSVGELKAIQGFNVIFFSEEAPQMISDVLLPANEQGRQRLHAFLEIDHTQKGSDPVPSLRLAFAQQPDLIYLLTDGDFTNTELGEGAEANRRVIAEVQRLNADKHVKINTIAFRAIPETRAEYINVLRQIADDSGGTIGFVMPQQNHRQAE